MTMLIKTRPMIEMGDLWDIIATDYDFSLAKSMLLKTGIEGPTPSCLTPIHAVLAGIENVLMFGSGDILGATRGNDESRTALLGALEFMYWAFDNGAAPKIDYMESAVRMAEHTSDPAVLTVVACLKENRVPVELADGERYTPLHIAAAIGSTLLTDYLIDECKASVDKRDADGMTPLFTACQIGNAKIVRSLLDHGADSTIRDASGATAISMCPGTDADSVHIRDLLKLRSRYRSGPVNAPGGEYRIAERIHRTARGDLVRSKSEVIIADALFYIGCDYEYEKAITDGAGQQVLPDFTIRTASAICVWEHLGMMDSAEYRAKWEKKAAWYKRNGYLRDLNLFVTLEDKASGIDSHEVRKIALQIRTMVTTGA